MSWNYNDYISQKLLTIANRLDYKGDILVSDELAFAKVKNFLPNTIYVVIKRLSTQLTNETETEPVQIVVFCEQNILVDTQTLFDIFVSENNWQTIDTNDNSIFIKQEYDKPVVISNFNEIGTGYRSILTISGTLLYVKNLLDVKEITITADSKSTTIKPLNFNWAYSMTPDIQQQLNENISSSVKSVSTVNISFAIAFTETDLIDSITKVMSGTDTGNKTFSLSFALKTGATPITYDMKLVSASVNTTQTSIAGLQVGFVK